MKAWESQGNGLENLRLVERPTPKPGPRELLVRVSAASLNHRDQDILDGDYPPEVSPRPMIPLSDAAGIVAETGEGVTRFRAGDRVTTHLFARWLDGEPGLDEEKSCYGGPRDGGLAEYMLLHEDAAVAPPPSMNDAEASTLPIAALTAWFAMVEKGDLQPGQSVLVQGTGVVSLFAVQIAAALGARVIATSSDGVKLDRLKKLGASDVINYKTSPEWQKAAQDLTDGKGVDQVIEVVGGDSIRRSIEAARSGGQVAVIGYLGDHTAAIDLMPLFFRRTKIQGIAVGHRKAFERMNAFLETHQIKPVIDTIYPFADARKAFEHRRNGAFGKIVIQVADQP